MDRRFGFLWPYPQKVKISDGHDFIKPAAIFFDGMELPNIIVQDLKDFAQVDISAQDEHAYPVTLSIISGTTGNNEGYVLKLSAGGGHIIADTAKGVFYGLTTLTQILAYSRQQDFLPAFEIEDWPRYEYRGFMVDMGRSAFSTDYLKCIIRIMSRLKMNRLHLHLYDDELCGIRFEGLPFGYDNPFAITISDLAELVKYSAAHCIEIIPELEAWGHVGSLTYHRKDLRGGDGMFGGSSFLICKKTFELMRELMQQTISAMPSNSTIHLGLDEAGWYPGNELPEDYTPTDMVGTYYDILQEISTENNKQTTLAIWADHAGRAVPEKCFKNTVIQPWMYWAAHADKIKEYVKRYSDGPMKWVAGAGQSAGQYAGAYLATRIWCREAAESKNCLGVNVTFWGRNDLACNFSTIFGGVYYAWNPLAQGDPLQDENLDTELSNRIIYPIMQKWQAIFREARPDRLTEIRGENVFAGYYLWGEKHGQPVSPTAAAANTFGGHDYLKEV